MQKILYFLTPGTNISPFDVTIAADAGFDIVMPITNVDAKQVGSIIQDAIFCRPPNRFNDTGIFIGGRDVHLAADMFQNAKSAMVGPFEVGVFVDHLTGCHGQVGIHLANLFCPINVRDAIGSFIVIRNL